MDYSSVILAPVLTEKSLQAQEKRVWSFFVHPRATKGMIKEALEKGFSVHPIKIRTLSVRPKTKSLRRSRRTVVLARKKKAFIWLPEGEKIKEIDMGKKERKK